MLTGKSEEGKRALGRKLKHINNVLEALHQTPLLGDQLEDDTVEFFTGLRNDAELYQENLASAREEAIAARKSTQALRLAINAMRVRYSTHSTQFAALRLTADAMKLYLLQNLLARSGKRTKTIWCTISA